MLIFYVFIIAAAFIVSDAEKFKSKSLPSYIKACSKSNDLSGCALKHGAEAIKHVVKGDKYYKSPSLTPWLVEKVDVTSSDKFQLNFTDAIIYGLENAILKDIKIDVDKRHIDLVVFVKKTTLEAQYKINGQLLVLPITGEGPIKLIFDDCTFYYSFDFDLTKKANGKTYITNIRPKTSFKIGGGHFQLDNLFNGNKALGDNINKVLNENPSETINELGDVISNLINIAATTIIKSYLLPIPYEELILP